MQFAMAPPRCPFGPMFSPGVSTVCVCRPSYVNCASNASSAAKSYSYLPRPSLSYHA